MSGCFFYSFPLSSSHSHRNNIFNFLRRPGDLSDGLLILASELTSFI
uniref:Uncharacterized protein n=1 Tax=Rhizophora mucronata TaxID=61149 RepID=A0A2P2QLI1_RHIMU